ncbi:hypothetical protein SAMN05880501_102200 [Ureibacillus xyleni]|uniref:STAS domain-containing protein n=1 Tax=Ureibacillus xyleni TaxID=614648 RepID=A0A285RXX6_9BACL|nr:hypothetical protein [Ureibacillus xyleni]SOB99408.1 hypothetical protein SAMN05880501_102200 [Ureibacillus xyleni]
MSQTGSYSIFVNQTEKTIDMSVKGTFTPQQAKDFHNDYQSKVGSINANNFTLKVDCKNMNIITQEMLPALETSFKMYKDSQFDKVEFIIEKSPVIKMQLSRIARNAGLANSEVIEV